VQHAPRNADSNDATPEGNENVQELVGFVNKYALKPSVDTSAAAPGTAAPAKRVQPSRSSKGKLVRPSMERLSYRPAKAANTSSDPYALEQFASPSPPPKRKRDEVEGTISEKRPPSVPESEQEAAPENRSAPKKRGKLQRIKKTTKQAQIPRRKENKGPAQETTEVAAPGGARLAAPEEILDIPEPSRSTTQRTARGTKKPSESTQPSRPVAGEDQTEISIQEPSTNRGDEDAVANDRVFGQKARLRAVAVEAKAIISQAFGSLTTNGSTIGNMCKVASHGILEAMKSRDGDLAAHRERFDDTLDDIFGLVDEMTPKDPGLMRHIDRKRVVQDIYVHIAPWLAFLTYRALQLYEAEAAGEDKDISPACAKRLEVMTTLIVESHDRVRNWKIAPVTTEPITKRTQAGIIAPLRRVMIVLMSVVNASERQQKNEEKVMLARREIASRRPREEQKRRQQQEQIERNNIWRELRISRMIVENDPWRLQKLRSPPEHEPEPDLDANNEPFERVDVFNARNGTARLHPHKRVQLEDWEDSQLDALVDALREFPRKSKSRARTSSNTS
jgi:hypothetical protein